MNGIIANHNVAKVALRQTIQATIDATKTAAERNRLGQFATPHALALEIARFVGSLIDDRVGSIRFADPSIGSGSFFSAALEVYGSHRIQSAIGIELDPTFANAARDLWTDGGLEVIQDDFVNCVADGTRSPAPNLILANPPYVRHHHLERQYKERLKRIAFEMTGIEVNGLAGLYVYFLLLATAWMEQDGFAAWLIPSEFMDVNYGASLKQFLTDRVTLIRAHRFDPEDVQFGDAFVSSAVLIFKNSPPASDHQPEFTFGGSIAEPFACDRISLENLRMSHKWTVYPRHVKNDRHTFHNEFGPTLGDLFHIKRGIATGCNKFFILDRSDAERRGIPAEYLRPILPSPRYLKTTVIDADEKGYPLIDRQLCVIDCDLPEHLVESRHPELWTYLQNARTLGVLDGYLVGKRKPWYKQEKREPAPFLCTYMGRGKQEKQPVRVLPRNMRARRASISSGF